MDEQGLKTLGLEEIFGSFHNTTLVEWAERAKDLLPKETVWINFIAVNDKTRKIEINNF